MLKIRAKSKHNKNKWLYGTGIVDITVNGESTGRKELIMGVSYNDNSFPTYNTEEIIPETIGYYTNLTDIKGKEIYSDDIIEEKGLYRSHFLQVQWKVSYSCWLKGEYERLTPANIEKGKITVAGNMTDSPELLERENY